MSESRPSEINLLGVGLYSVPQAARLVRRSKETAVSAQSIRRWMWGHPIKRRGVEGYSEALWTPSVPLLEGGRFLTFQDLIEILFVSAFRHRGHSLQSIRRILTKAEELVQHPRPFSHLRFASYRMQIVADFAAEPEHRQAVELDSGQLLLGFIFDELISCLDYSEIATATRWWPLGKKKAVVLDSERHFGRPILAESGVPTAALFGAYQSEKSVRAVADWFGISAASVADALEYEESLRAA